MMYKIILIGANGFFGKNILDSFSKKKYVIKKVFRNTNLNKINFKNYDYLINAAAEVYNEKKMFKCNTLLVENILKKCIRENKNIKIIHFGSSGEYGALEKKLSEKDLLTPRTVYEGTKAAASMLVKSYSEYFKIKSIIIKPFSVYGLHENPTRLIPNIFRSLMGKQNLKIYNGNHDYVYIKDLILFLKKIISKNLIKKNGEILNFGSGISYSNKQILNFCEKILDRKSNAIFIKKFNKVYDKKLWCCNNKYLLNNFKFKYTIKSGIRDYAKNYQKFYKINFTVL